MYIVKAWDSGKEYMFDSYIDALQFGNKNFGSRYDLIEIELIGV